MDDLVKIALAALFFLIGSHLLLWAWLKRKIASVRREMEVERSAREDGDADLSENSPEN